MTFAHPWFFLLLLLLPLTAWLRKRLLRESAFLYSSVALVKGITSLSQSRSGQILRFLRWLALILFIVAMARPQFREGRTSISASGVDIAVALDLSRSMSAEDFEVGGQRRNRLTVAKGVLEEFIDKRPNDRIGLIAFAKFAYVAAPLTLDHEFLLKNLERLDFGIIDDGTAIGSAVTAGLNRLRKIESESKIMILVTDGRNNYGKVDPLTAAEAAEALGVKIYAIGVGTDGAAPVPVGEDAFGRTRYRQQNFEIDEETLKKVAEMTEGQYYRADSAGAFRKIYDEIDRLEKTEVDVQKYVSYEELFPWALLPGLTALLLEIILSHTVWRKLP